MSLLEADQTGTGILSADRQHRPAERGTIREEPALTERENSLWQTAEQIR